MVHEIVQVQGLEEEQAPGQVEEQAHGQIICADTLDRPPIAPIIAVVEYEQEKRELGVLGSSSVPPYRTYQHSAYQAWLKNSITETMTAMVVFVLVNLATSPLSMPTMV